MGFLLGAHMLYCEEFGSIKFYSCRLCMSKSRNKKKYHRMFEKDAVIHLKTDDPHNLFYVVCML